jgi:hypothetical protein
MNFEMHISKRLLLGLGLATLIMESVVSQPALAADKVSLFKVITARDEIVIGISDGELAQIEGRNAGGIAKMLVARGSMSAWQYAVRKSVAGDLEQAPLHKIGLIASDSLRVEPYATPLKVLPIDETKQ